MSAWSQHPLSRFLCQLNIKREVAMASAWCSQGRCIGASMAAWSPGNCGVEEGRQAGELGGNTRGSCTCSRAATQFRGRGLTVPQCKPWVLGSCRIYVKAYYCSAGIFVLAACFCWLAVGRGRSLVSQPQHGMGVLAQGNGCGSCGRLRALCWLRKVESQKAGTGKVLARRWVRG